VILKVVAIRQNSADTRGEPSKGTKFVSIQIVADNSKGTEEWDIEPAALKLKDVDGNVYEVELFTSVAEPTLKSGVIDAGDRVRGWVTFQVGVSIDVSSLRLRYEGTLSKSGWITLSSVVEAPRGDRSGLPPIFPEGETL
jgi:hypothetical protein